MATQSQKICRLIRMYIEEKGVEEYSMPEVVQYAVDRGLYKLPPPIGGIEQLTKKFANAAAEEVRMDEVTGKPYRAHHARWDMQDGKQIPLWFDMDRVTRPTLQKYAFQRRQHLVSEVVQLTLSLDHWNRVHPAEEPVRIEPDFTDDVEWAKNAPEDLKKAS